MAFLLVNVEPVSRSLSSLCCQLTSSVLPSGAKLSLGKKKNTNQNSSLLGLNSRGLCRSHRLPVMAHTWSDEACCDGCPHGSSCVNGWLFNLCLKRRFQGSRTKDERTRSAAMMVTGRISPPEGEVCRKFGNLRWFKWGCCQKSSGC